MTDSAKGLLMVFTGKGKGKTTSALGLTLRALGHGHRVCFIQFIKGSWQYGELEAAKQYKDLLDFHVMGRGFTWKSDDLEKDIAVAREAWEYAKKIIAENKHHLVVLDELTYLVTYKMIDEQEMVDVLTSRDPSMHIVVTGRGAGDKLTEAADLVTEMREINHGAAEGDQGGHAIEF